MGLFDPQPPSLVHLFFLSRNLAVVYGCALTIGVSTTLQSKSVPSPTGREALDRLGRAKPYTQLDLTNAYYWVRIAKGDEWKTTFRTRYGHLEYQVMPFGLSNAPATFQGLINRILAEKLDVFCIVYLDDILICTEEAGLAHIEAVRWVLEQLLRHGLYANLQKCRFSQEEVRYINSPEGIRMENERINSVCDWPRPQCVRDVQVFLDFVLRVSTR